MRPDISVRRIFDLDPSTLRGMDLVVLDLDNTLVLPETCDTLPEIRTWVSKVREHSRCVIASNSRTRKDRRVRIEELFGCPLLSDAPHKPCKALERHLTPWSGASKPHTAVIGDRLLTDVLFGKRIGALTVLVEPLSKRERWDIRVLRAIENELLRFLGS